MLGQPQEPKAQGHCGDHLWESHGQPLAEPLPQASAPWLLQSWAVALRRPQLPRILGPARAPVTSTQPGRQMTQSGHMDTKGAASAHGWLRSPRPLDKDEGANPVPATVTENASGRPAGPRPEASLPVCPGKRPPARQLWFLEN